MSEHTDDVASVFGSSVTMHILPFEAISRTDTSIRQPMCSFPSEPLRALVKGRNPETPVTPKSKIYPWSSMLCTEAESVYMVLIN